ncbi:hypothetical protein KGQ71_02425 [Patescibacteria group bacterium]|nr:hypothetical protein [Patescibacteria group bacterium]
MDEDVKPAGEFHHFQLVNTDGDVRLSISVLVHYSKGEGSFAQEMPPIGDNEIIDLHEALQHFDGDYAKAFNRN